MAYEQNALFAHIDPTEEHIMRQPKSTELSMNRLGFEVVKRLPRKQLTLLAGKAAEVELPELVRAGLYTAFANRVGANLGEVEQELKEYTSLGDFFVRKLQVGARPWQAEAGDWGSPADGRLDAHGRIEQGQMLQAKGIEYSVAQMVADEEVAAALEGGLYATVYLSPADYHRVHVPCGARITKVLHHGGELWPVNQLSVPFVQGLFAVNERVIAYFEDEKGRTGVMVMVGATVVAKMSVAHPEVDLSDLHGRGVHGVEFDEAWQCAPGDEFGAFHLGSTVVLAMQDEGSMELAAGLTSGSPLRMGDQLFTTTD